MFCCISKHLMQKWCVISLAILLTAVATGSIVLFSLPQPVAVAVSTQEWGLSFQKDAASPVPNLSANELAPYDAFYYNSAAEKRIYLTFDAGYENGNMPAILDALKKHGVTGAFFVVGTYIKQNPELIQRMVAEGHIVGNHTYHHPNMAQKDKAAFCQELAALETAFTELTGHPLEKFYRPPEGKFTYDNLAWARALGYKTVFWSLAYVDWHTDNQPSREKAFEKLLPRTHSGAIVLLHSTSATNAAILDDLITEWKAAGYRFGTLRELGGAA